MESDQFRLHKCYLSQLLVLVCWSFMMQSKVAWDAKDGMSEEERKLSRATKRRCSFTIGDVPGGFNDPRLALDAVKGCVINDVHPTLIPLFLCQWLLLVAIFILYHP